MQTVLTLQLIATLEIEKVSKYWRCSWRHRTVYMVKETHLWYLRVFIQRISWAMGGQLPWNPCSSQPTSSKEGIPLAQLFWGRGHVRWSSPYHDHVHRRQLLLGGKTSRDTQQWTIRTSGNNNSWGWRYSWWIQVSWCCSSMQDFLLLRWHLAILPGCCFESSRAESWHLE